MPLYRKIVRAMIVIGLCMWVYFYYRKTVMLKELRIERERLAIGTHKLQVLLDQGQVTGDDLIEAKVKLARSNGILSDCERLVGPLTPWKQVH